MTPVSCPQADCPYRDQLAVYEVNVPRLEKTVGEHSVKLIEHGELLASIRGWTAGAAAAGAVLGGFLVTLLQKYIR